MFERQLYQVPFGWQQPHFMPPRFIPMAPYMPNPMGHAVLDHQDPPSMQDEPFPAPRNCSLDRDSMQPRLQPTPYDRQGGGVSFQDQIGTASPSMLHTSRPRGGMRGAPELAPEDIGNVGKFNEFLQKHAAYAASAREQGQSWATVAGLLSRYADDLAVAFNACALKRHGQATFDATAVLSLSDDTFERLYLEACAPSVEYPSQVLELLEAVPFIRQQPHETSPMPAILRAAEAFRVQLRLLPGRAVSDCKEDALAMSFMTLLFGQSAKHRSNDFQRCTTWIQLKNALIQCAAATPAWFGTALLDSPLPPPTDKHKPSTSVASTSSSNTSATSTTGDHKRMADRVMRLRESGELKGLELEGLSDKQILKMYNKARWRSKIREQAVEEAQLGNAKLLARLDEQQRLLASLTQQVKGRGESRERHYEHTDRPRDNRQQGERPRDDRHRDERPRDDRHRDERPRDDRHRDERSRDDHGRQEGFNARSRSQEPAAPHNVSSTGAGRAGSSTTTSPVPQRQPSPATQRRNV